MGNTTSVLKPEAGMERKTCAPSTRSLYLSALSQQQPPALLLCGAWNVPYVLLSCLCSVLLQFKPMYALCQWEMQLFLTAFRTSYRVKLQTAYARIFPAPLFSEGVLSCLACLKLDTKERFFFFKSWLKKY